MKPEFLPRPPEKIAVVIAFVGALFCFAGLIVHQLIPLTHTPMVENMVGAEQIMWISFLLFLSGVGAASVLSKERRAIIKYDTYVMRTAAADPPVIPEHSMAHAIAVLQWSIDFNTHLRANYTMIRSRMTITTCAYLAGVAAWFIDMYVAQILRQPTIYRASNMTFIVELVTIFAAYIALLVALVIYGTRKVLREQYSGNLVQNYALLLDPDGLNLIAGAVVSVVPWKWIKSIVVYKDVLFVNAIPWQQLIPSYTFHSASDAKAFAATARALKRHKQVPVHDWSGYSNASDTAAGSWPPAIRSEN